MALRLPRFFLFLAALLRLHGHSLVRGVLYRLALVRGAGLRAGLPQVAVRAGDDRPRRSARSCSSSSGSTCGCRSACSGAASSRSPRLTVRASSRSTPAASARSSTPALVVAAVLIGLYSASSWATWLYAIHAAPFGRTDPVLGRDIAFYLFRLPMLELVHGHRADDDHPDDRRRRRRARRRRQPGARSAARRDRQPQPPGATCRCSPPRSCSCSRSARGSAFRIC